MTWTIRPRRSRQERDDRSLADALFTLGDILGSGHDTPARESRESNPGDDDLGDTFRRVQRTLGDPATTLEPAVKHRIWEDIMHAHVGHPGAHIDGGRRRVRISGTSPRPTSALATTVARWQPTVSLVVMVAFLVSLVGLAYNRGIWDDSGTLRQPASQSGELDPFTPDRPTPTETSVLEATCTPRTEERLSEDDLRAFSINDWNPPTYYNAKPASPEIAQMAIDTYLGFLKCEFNDPFATPSAAPDTSAARETYLSDRMRYLLLYDTLTPAQRREIDDFLTDNPSDEIIENFPLPVNRDIDRLIAVADNSFFINTFMVGEVYQLPDGRYGAIMGSISTQMLVEQRPVRESDGVMTFIAFWPEDGQLYIDEMLGLCVPGLVPLEMPADATPVSADSLEEALGPPEYAACT